MAELGKQIDENGGKPQVVEGHTIMLAFMGGGSLDFRPSLNDVTAGQLFIASEYLREAALELIGDGWRQTVRKKSSPLPRIITPGM